MATLLTEEQAHQAQADQRLLWDCLDKEAAPDACKLSRLSELVEWVVIEQGYLLSIRPLEPTDPPPEALLVRSGGGRPPPYKLGGSPVGQEYEYQVTRLGNSPRELAAGLVTINRAMFLAARELSRLSYKQHKAFVTQQVKRLGATTVASLTFRNGGTSADHWILGSKARTLEFVQTQGQEVQTWLRRDPSSYGKHAKRADLVIALANKAPQFDYFALMLPADSYSPRWLAIARPVTTLAGLRYAVSESYLEPPNANTSAVFLSGQAEPTSHTSAASALTQMFVLEAQEQARRCQAETLNMEQAVSWLLPDR